MGSKLITCVTCLLATFSAVAQKIEGFVTEAGKAEPVQFANVYFANTTIGTTTNEEGYFVMGGFTSGKYDLTVSFVGYNTYSRSIEVRPNEEIKITIELIPEVVSLPEIFVTADTSDWYDNFAEFRKYFLGTTRASKQCEIVNKRSLAFYFDPKERILYAHGREPLVIRNGWLGYEIVYDLVSFEMNHEIRKLAYYGIPRFDFLQAGNKKEERHWKKNRKKVYMGSLLHFFRSVTAESFEEDKFEVQELFKIPNPDRLPEKIIQDRMAYHRERVVKRGVTNASDSLSYYVSEKRKPKYIDSLGIKFKDGSKLMNQDTVDYKGILKVVYKGAKESMTYPFKKNPRPGFQKSLLHIYGKLKLYENGYYEDVRSTFVEGYWSWTGTMSNILPMDYVPERKKK